jgi:hypothetical protein
MANRLATTMASWRNAAAEAENRAGMATVGRAVGSLPESSSVEREGAFVEGLSAGPFTTGIAKHSPLETRWV